MLHVNEIFTTIQGEARFTGTPSLFIRLQGCPVGCPWCDTKHTWELENEKKVLSFQSMLSKLEDAPTYAEVLPEYLFDYCTKQPISHIVITGGEPFMQDIQSFTKALCDSGYKVQVETSGTRPIHCDDRTWITLSPKIDMPGGFEICNESLRRANEIKMPVENQSDIIRLMALLKNADHPDIDVWLQPVSMNQKATQLCVDSCIKYGFKLSVQTHKVANIR